MRKIILIIAILSIVSLVFAGTMYIHMDDGTITEINIDDIEMITFEPELDTLLVAYYPFNSNADDESGNGNNGTIYGATLTTDRFGNPNSAYEFDGIDDYIEVMDSPDLDLTEDFTISIWIYPVEELRWYGYIAKHYHHTNTDHSWMFKIFNDGTPYMEVYDHTGPGNPMIVFPDTVQLNVWTHLAVTYDKSTFSSVAYINYYQQSVGADTLDILDTDKNLSFGSWEPYLSTTAFFYGSIDDIRIYKRVLTGDEIQALYEEGVWPRKK